MSLFFWFSLLLVNYFCLFSLNSLILGIFILGCRFFVRILVRFYSLSWYSLIFFIVYIGGLLVLFIYISSLKFKPVFKIPKVNSTTNLMLKGNVLFLFLLCITQITWNFKAFRWNEKEIKNFRFNLFKEVEVLFLIKVGFLLLVVLWVITKLSFRNRRALRPFFR